jgi:hypothetical protein
MLTSGRRTPTMREMGDHLPDGTVAFRTLDSDDGSVSTNHHAPGLWAARTDHEWRWHWEQLHDDPINPLPAMPPVDWTTEMVLVLALGGRPSSGYRVAIDRLVAGDDSLQVHAHERRPGPTCVTLTVMTSPYDVVATAARDVELCLVLRVEIYDC